MIDIVPLSSRCRESGVLVLKCRQLLERGAPCWLYWQAVLNRVRVAIQQGLGEMEKYRADQLAQAGYFAFALDVYGKGIRPTTVPEAQGNVTACEANTTDFHGRQTWCHHQLVTA